MNAPADSNPERAFIKLASWRRALVQLKAALGIEIEDGEKEILADGATAFRFNPNTTRRPFGVSPDLWMQAGLFIYGGRITYFPAQRLDTQRFRTWTVGIRFLVSFVGDGTPDTLYLDQTILGGDNGPRLSVEALGTIGTNARLRLIAGNYEVMQTGEVFWPIASFDGTTLIEHQPGEIRSHLQVEIQANGDTRGGFWSYPLVGV